MTLTTRRATLEDLARVEGKAELIAGSIVPLMPTGHWPNRIAARIFRSLDDYAEATGRGTAYTDNIGYAVGPLASGRESFSPDASYYVGPLPLNPMRFLPGPPTLAVEVRSENDYDESAEAALAAKRVDYFEAGTLVVWDVDPVARCVRVYRRDDPTLPTVWRAGQEAEAGPAVPGWKLSVDSLFR